MKFDETVKLQELLQSYFEDKTVIVTSKCWASTCGKNTEFGDRRLYILNKSNGPSNISNDELFQKMRQKVIHTAHMAPDKTRDTLRDQTKELYPDNNVNVFVWAAGNISKTGFSFCKAFAKFLTSDDKSYGHDILIIIK